jgi:AraC-like DNA-binding protein
MQIYGAFLNSLLDYAAFRNMDVKALKNLIEDSDFKQSHPDEMVDAKDYLKVLQRIVDFKEDDNTGLNIGTYFNLSSLGLVLEISLSTSSIKQGIFILKNFLESKFPIVSLHLNEQSGSKVLCFESIVDDKRLSSHLLDMVLCIVNRELKLMLPKGINPQVSLPFKEKEQVDLFFDGEATYAESHKIVLPQDLDKLEINVNRIKEIEILLPKFISMLNQNDNNSDEFSKNVRGMALNMCNPEIPNLKQVQKQFPCSERTFQRKLTVEGTSFRNIVNDIKKELAEYLSNERHLRTKDIAYILGYSGPSAYLHALKRWQSELEVIENNGNRSNS